MFEKILRSSIPEPAGKTSLNVENVATQIATTSPMVALQITQYTGVQSVASYKI